MRRTISGALALLALGLVAAAPASARYGFLRAWGTVGNGDGQFALPDGLGVANDGTVWVADRDNNRLERFTSNGRFQPFPPFRHQHRSAAPGRLNVPYDVAADPLGNLYVADTHNDRIQEFSPTGRLIRKWGRRGSAAGEFWDPRGVAIDPFGNVWVADARAPTADELQKFPGEDKKGSVVVKFSPEGQVLMTLGKPGVKGNPPDALTEPNDVATDPANGTTTTSPAKNDFRNDGHSPFITGGL